MSSFLLSPVPRVYSKEVTKERQVQIIDPVQRVCHWYFLISSLSFEQECIPAASLLLIFRFFKPLGNPFGKTYCLSFLSVLPLFYQKDTAGPRRLQQRRLLINSPAVRIFIYFFTNVSRSAGLGLLAIFSYLSSPACISCDPNFWKTKHLRDSYWITGKYPSGIFAVLLGIYQPLGIRRY